MVNARLHIICGNCGCKDLFEASVDSTGHDYTDEVEKFEFCVYIYCRNCGTLHDLSCNLRDPHIKIKSSQCVIQT